MSSTTLPVCPKTGSTSPSLTVHLCLHTVPGNRECARLDLTAFYALYEGDGRRNAPYEPRMMVKVLLYAYATGVFSSRRVARKLEEDVAFRVLAAGNLPQHRTLCEFRRRHLEDFQALFVGGGPSGAGVGSGALGEAVDRRDEGARERE